MVAIQKEGSKKESKRSLVERESCVEESNMLVQTRLKFKLVILHTVSMLLLDVGGGREWLEIFDLQNKRGETIFDQNLS